MIASPDSMWEARSSTVFSVGAPAGTITQAARGFESFLAKSASEVAPVAPAPASCFTLSGLRSYTTHSWPPFIKRRTMLAPMRPRPIIPSCTARAPFLRRLLQATPRTGIVAVRTTDSEFIGLADPADDQPGYLQGLQLGDHLFVIPRLEVDRHHRHGVPQLVDLSVE